MKLILKTATVAMLLASAQLLPMQSASAAPYFKCQSGYAFGINSAGTGAHCKKQVAPKVKPISCPSVKFLGNNIGTFPYTKSGKDVCRGQVTVAGVTQITQHAPLACPSGYSYKKNHQGKKDRCVKPGGWIFKAPTVQFNSN